MYSVMKRLLKKYRNHEKSISCASHNSFLRKNLKNRCGIDARSFSNHPFISKTPDIPPQWPLCSNTVLKLTHGSCACVACAWCKCTMCMVRHAHGALCAWRTGAHEPSTGVAVTEDECSCSKTDNLFVTKSRLLFVNLEKSSLHTK